MFALLAYSASGGSWTRNLLPDGWKDGSGGNSEYWGAGTSGDVCSFFFTPTNASVHMLPQLLPADPITCIALTVDFIWTMEFSRNFFKALRFTHVLFLDMSMLSRSV